MLERQPGSRTQFTMPKTRMGDPIDHLSMPVPSAPCLPPTSIQEFATLPSAVPFPSARAAIVVKLAISTAFTKDPLVSIDGLNKGSIPLGNCPCIYLFMNASKGAPPRHISMVTTALPWLSCRSVCVSKPVLAKRYGQRSGLIRVKSILDDLLSISAAPPRLLSLTQCRATRYPVSLIVDHLRNAGGTTRCAEPYVASAILHVPTLIGQYHGYGHWDLN